MSSTFESYVNKSILSNNEFGIKEVNNLENVWSGYFEQKRYEEIARLIKEGKIDQLQGLYDTSKDNFSEYLDIMRFKDQNENAFIVTVFDSDELTQDTQVIEIFKL
jgi:predicted patatin/cPLA2 family phospholipase